jgi:hypothetical protein
MTISPIKITASQVGTRDFDSMLVIDTGASLWALPSDFRPDTGKAREFFLAASHAILSGCAAAYTPGCKGWALTEAHAICRAIANACESWTSAANRLPIRF